MFRSDQVQKPFSLQYPSAAAAASDGVVPRGGTQCQQLEGGSLEQQTDQIAKARLD